MTLSSAGDAVKTSSQTGALASWAARGAVWTRRAHAPNLEGLAKQPRGAGEKTGPSRKVRTPQGRVVGKPDPGKPAGKCHRNDTAKAAGTHVPSSPARGKRCGKSAPAARRRAVQGKPHPVQGQAGTSTLPAESQVGRRTPRGAGPAQAGPDGWLLTTESGLPASYGEAPRKRGLSTFGRQDEAAAYARASRRAKRLPVNLRARRPGRPAHLATNSDGSGR